MKYQMYWKYSIEGHEREQMKQSEIIYSTWSNIQILPQSNSLAHMSFICIWNAIIEPMLSASTVHYNHVGQHIVFREWTEARQLSGNNNEERRINWMKNGIGSEAIEAAEIFRWVWVICLRAFCRFKCEHVHRSIQAYLIQSIYIPSITSYLIVEWARKIWAWILSFVKVCRKLSSECV